MEFHILLHAQPAAAQRVVGAKIIQFLLPLWMRRKGVSNSYRLKATPFHPFLLFKPEPLSALAETFPDMG
uniref:SFRICE_032054 n=1 Tax=Spodoptera frugiperda TaxID=7108 RepID=A0A2H1WX65_SPOFR